MPRIFLKARDPISSYTHFIGAWLSVIGLVVMGVHLAVTPGVTAVTAVSCILFCLSLIALYCASSIYHFTNAAAKIQTALRKLDHAMIYVLIARDLHAAAAHPAPPPEQPRLHRRHVGGRRRGHPDEDVLAGRAPLAEHHPLHPDGWRSPSTCPRWARCPCRGSCCSWWVGSPIPWAASSTWSSAPTSPNGSGSMRFSTSSSLPGSVCHYLMVLLYIV